MGTRIDSGPRPAGAPYAPTPETVPGLQRPTAEILKDVPQRQELHLYAPALQELPAQLLQPTRRFKTFILDAYTYEWDSPLYTLPPVLLDYTPDLKYLRLAPPNLWPLPANLFQHVPQLRELQLFPDDLYEFLPPDLLLRLPYLGHALIYGEYPPHRNITT